ncbi:MAG: 30S ribosomal protein S8 [Chlamydiales bacterium]|nr:30S ribosomal protein S8 [Chlamydiia bacterium]MCP5506890.1 30S ribosomal protein S8 [Chlamydiales bacterium]
MAFNDPVADFLTRIRNGQSAQKRFVDIGWSKMKEQLAEILKEKGYVESYLVKKDENHRGTIRVFLKYTMNRKPVINGLKRVSKPGLRKYVKHQDIPRFYGGLGLSILSTSNGVMAGTEASQKKIGGELLCMVW